MSWRKGECFQRDTPRCDACEEDMTRADICEGENVCSACREANREDT